MNDFTDDRNFLYTQTATFHTLDDMNSEAKQMLQEKEKELESYRATVTEAEEMLSKLQKEVREKTEELHSLQNYNPEEEEEKVRQAFYKEIDDLKEKQANEIREIRLKHEEELSLLRSDFERSLSDAEQWNEKHSSIAYQQKLEELKDINNQTQAARLQLNTLTFTQKSAVSTIPVDEQQKANSFTIAELETQISELTSLSREELRTAASKVDELVASVEIRKEEHKNELKKLEIEISKRKEIYKEHFETLKQQFKLEEETIQKEIDAHINRTFNIENLIDHIGKHHEVQVSSINKDIDTIRRSILTPKDDLRHSYDSLRFTVRESQRLSDECHSMDDETRIIDQELFQLEIENKSLSKELKRLTRQMKI